jgi:hypothetical protein
MLTWWNMLARPWSGETVGCADADIDVPTSASAESSSRLVSVPFSYEVKSWSMSLVAARS